MIIVYVAFRAQLVFAASLAIHPILGWGYLAALGSAALGLGALFLRSMRRYQRLCDVTQLQTLAERVRTGQVLSPADKQAVRDMIEKYLENFQGRSSKELSNSVHRLQLKLEEYSGHPKDDFENLERFVLDKLDREADRLINARALQVVFGTALASHLFDSLIVLWQSLTLINGISQLYAGRPGVLGTLRLVRRGLIMVVFAEATELGTTALIEMISANKLSERLGGRAVQGAANGFLMIRLGEAVKRQCRPVPLPPSASSKLISRLLQGLNVEGAPAG